MSLSPDLRDWIPEDDLVRIVIQAGRRLDAKPKQAAEPIFGIIKSVMGFRQALLRGLGKVGGEWDLVCPAYNVRRLLALIAA